ncbi:MAG: 2OG-Fe(II) oxygenase [Sphingobacteriales bacterium]|nr:2OG-Fe(II) oxygenase [Sphingobacteriales bacterium]
MPSSFDTLTESYIRNKTGIDPCFINEKLAEGLRQNIFRSQEDGLLNAAGIGNKAGKNIQQQIRGDKIQWLDKKSSNSFEQEFLQQAEDLIGYLNRTCYTGINAYEFHYAVYEKDSFYKRHLDQFQNNGSRKFSLITYLNMDWKEEDGGQLHIYQDDHTEKILPHSRTAVFFKSDELEHEVTATQRQRMSITGWLKQV